MVMQNREYSPFRINDAAHAFFVPPGSLFFRSQITSEPDLTTTAKILGGGAIIALVWWGAKYLQNAAKNFQFDVTGYGRPQIQSTFLTVPLLVKFTNPTPIPVSVDNFRADIYLNKNGTYVPAGFVAQALTVPPGTTEQWINPSVDLKAIFGGDMVGTGIFLAQLLAKKAIDIRTDISVVFAGITLPKQSFTNNLAF